LSLDNTHSRKLKGKREGKERGKKREGKREREKEGKERKGKEKLIVREGNEGDRAKGRGGSGRGRPKI
jgi:hypothetical protein